MTATFQTWTRRDIPQLVLAGFAATVLLTLVLIPIAQFAVAPISLVLHFVLGSVVFPLLFGFYVFDRLPGTAVMRAAVWGVSLWLFWQVLLMPMVGLGFFSSKAPQPVAQVFISLNAHVIYGVILGLLLTPKMRRTFRHVEKPLSPSEREAA